MANKKRKDINHSIKLGRIRWTRADILAIEDILRKHTVLREKYQLKNEIRAAKKTEKNGVVRRNTSDVHIETSFSVLGGRGLFFGLRAAMTGEGVNYDQDFDSIADLPERSRPPYLSVYDGADVSVSFSPLQTRIYAKRVARSPELRKSIDKAVERIQKRLSKRKQPKR